MTNKSPMLLEHNLKQLKLPTFLREYDKLASQCASEGADHPDYLLRLSELELIDRHHRMVERRIKAARFPTTKSLDTFDFLSMPSLNKALVLELARCEYIERPHNVIALGNGGTGKTHIALGLAACQRGLSVGFTTTAALVHELIEARDERRLLNLQRRLARLKLLIIDELGFVPLPKTGAELLFEVFSQRYERGSVLVTSNLPFVEWTEVFGSERLTGALLDRLTHHVDILEMNGDSYRLKRSKKSYHAFITDRDGETLELEADHRRHAEVENAIRDLKYGVGLNHMPSARFAANGAWLAVQVMAHNLARWTARIGLGERTVITKTLRRRVFALVGRITRSARRLTLHLPRRWPWETQFSRALARLQAIPFPA